MADVANAYEFLNQTLGLKLTQRQIRLAEARFREQFAREAGYAVEARGPKFHENWEFFTRLEPRKTALDGKALSIDELAKDVEGKKAD